MRCRRDATEAREISANYVSTHLADPSEALDSVACVCAPPDGHFAARMSTSERFGWLAAPRSTVVQPGASHGGTTDDPVAQLGRLCARYVGVSGDD